TPTQTAFPPTCRKSATTSQLPLPLVFHTISVKTAGLPDNTPDPMARISANGIDVELYFPSRNRTISSGGSATLGMHAYAFLTASGVRDCARAGEAGLTTKVARRTVAAKRLDQIRDI